MINVEFPFPLWFGGWIAPNAPSHLAPVYGFTFLQASEGLADYYNRSQVSVLKYIKAKVAIYDVETGDEGLAVALHRSILLWYIYEEKVLTKILKLKSDGSILDRVYSLPSVEEVDKGV